MKSSEQRGFGTQKATHSPDRSPDRVPSARVLAIGSARGSDLLGTALRSGTAHRCRAEGAGLRFGRGAKDGAKLISALCRYVFFENVCACEANAYGHGAVLAGKREI